jgi:3-oxoacyl-[acyl-carrier-protein] synthase III
MRISHDLYVAGTGVHLPVVVPVQPAIDAGLVDEAHRGLGYESVVVAGTAAPPDMAVAAARTAVRRSGIPPAEVGLALHASLWFQGLDMWASASYVADQSVGSQAVAFDVQQRSNGGMGAFQLAAAYLGSGGARAALVTTADRFDLPGINRWGSQFYTLFGDAGTALVLSRSSGFARVLSVASVADNGLEPWGRGSTPFGTAPGTELPVQVLRRAAEHAATPQAEGSWERIEAAMLRIRDQALDEAGATLDDISRAVLPFIHRGDGQTENYDTLGFTEKQTLWELGKRVGHLGAGDQFAGLNHLVENRMVGTGDRVLMVGVGVGFTFTAAVLEITELPDW